MASELYTYGELDTIAEYGTFFSAWGVENACKFDTDITTTLPVAYLYVEREDYDKFISNGDCMKALAQHRRLLLTIERLKMQVRDLEKINEKLDDDIEYYTSTIYEMTIGPDHQEECPPANDENVD